MSLTTQNLALVPLGPQHYLALIEGIPQFNDSLGIPGAEGLRDFIVSGEVSPEWIAQLRVAKSADPWTHGFAAVPKADQCVIGMVTFKGPPNDDGMVEIAYGIVPTYQCRGFATEASQAAIGFAKSDARVRIIRAHTKSDNQASIRVLNKLGFHFIGEVIEPEDGLVSRWELLNRP